MPVRYWLVHSNGARQLIDPQLFDLERLGESVRARGGTIVVEGLIDPRKVNKTPKRPRKPRTKASPALPAPASGSSPEPATALAGAVSAGSAVAFVPPAAALAPLFRLRLRSIHECRREFTLEISERPTNRVLGGYYPRRTAIKLYTSDVETGRRALDELFDTFLHEVAHHLEYTEPSSFSAKRCGRVRGVMHSPLFWKIYNTLRQKWMIVRDAETPRRKVEADADPV